jgi:hypothetical protein
MTTTKHPLIAFHLLSLGLYIASLHGCGGGGDSLTSVDISGGSGGDDGVVTLTWMPPTTNVDGTALDDLEGYRIYYGTSSGAYSNMIDLPTPGLTSNP